jgi:hypothetical protein
MRPQVQDKAVILLLGCCQGSERARGPTRARNVDGHEAGIAKHLAAALELSFAQVSQQDVLVRANPTSDRLTDRSGPDDDSAFVV